MGNGDKMKECPNCLTDKLVKVIKTEIDHRVYKCQKCQKEWKGRPTKKEKNEWN